MTKDEFKTFVEERFERHGVKDREVIQEIADQWEIDTDERWTEGVAAGRESAS